MANLTNNSKFKNSYFLSLAFEQAKINLGSTGINPSVGCVIEKNGYLISSGRTGEIFSPSTVFFNNLFIFPI